MAKRVSKPVITGVSEEQFNESLKNYCEASHRLDKLTAEMDLKINEIRNKNADKVKGYNATMEAQFDLIQKYCEENKEKLFDKKRTMQLGIADVGFRLDPPTLKTLKKMTWKAVLANIKSLMPKYVRTKEEVDKDSILADFRLHSDDLDNLGGGIQIKQTEDDVKRGKERLAQVGLEIVQEDNFFIKVKTEGE